MRNTGTNVIFECDVCGQIGNNPKYYNGKTLCNYHWDLYTSLDNNEYTEEDYREFKRLLNHFK